MNKFPTVKTYDGKEFPVLTRQQVKSCASVIQSVTWKIERIYPYKIIDWNPEWTVYPPNFNLGMSSGPSFSSKEKALEYIEEQGWRALPSSYILNE